jgi:hypothetical protein
MSGKPLTRTLTSICAPGSNGRAGPDNGAISKLRTVGVTSRMARMTASVQVSA